MNIIYSDIDNTFDSVSSKIPQINIDAIRKLQENGDRFVFVSGRNAHQIETLLQEIDVDCDYIFGNGAGYRMAGEAPVYKNTIDRSVLLEAKKLFDEHHLFYHFHTSEGVILEPVEQYADVFERLYKAFESYGEKGKEMVDYKYHYFKNSFQVEDPFQYVEQRKEIKLIKIELMETEPELISLVYDKFQSLGLVVFSSFATLIEIVPPASNKGDAIRAYNNFFQPDQTFAFGDADNDITMFEAVDVSVAVDNAPDHIKQRCTDQADHCEKGGVGKYIFEKILK